MTQAGTDGPGGGASKCPQTPDFVRRLLMALRRRTSSVACSGRFAPGLLVGVTVLTCGRVVGGSP